MILEKLLARYRVCIKSEIPSEYFDIYLKGGYEHVAEPIDVGCIQQDFIRIDVAQTFQALERFFKCSDQRIDAESRWLEDNRIDLIVTDIASAPLKAGRALGIPTLLIANFTWYDIHSRLPQAEKWKPLIKALREEYAQATIQILPQCHIDTPLIENRQEVGFISRKGKDRRHELEEAFSTSLKHKTLVFIYLGDSGAQNLDWKNLKKLDDCVFLTRDPLPRNIPNLHVLTDRFLYQDLIASSDIVLTKAGYSTLASAFAHDKPVLSCSRKHFYEFEVMKRFLYDNRVGLIFDSDKFYGCDWREEIDTAKAIPMKGKVRLDGDVEVVDTIDRMLTGL